MPPAPGLRARAPDYPPTDACGWAGVPLPVRNGSCECAQVLAPGDADCSRFLYSDISATFTPVSRSAIRGQGEVQYVSGRTQATNQPSEGKGCKATGKRRFA
jgi:hypothetical protein